MVEFLSGISFFQSVAFGVTSMVVTGASWCLIGAIAGKAPKDGLQMEHLLLAGGTVSVVGGVLLQLLTGNDGCGSCKFTVLFLTLAAFFIGGVNCFIQHMTMSRAMQSGPNGIIWAIIQSAMVFPFIAGVAFFDVKLTFLRLAGIILMLSSLVLFGMAKSGNSSGSGWKYYTFIAFAVVSANQVILSIPFYYEETGSISPLLCTTVSMAGYAAAALIYILFRSDNDGFAGLKRVLCIRRFWIYSTLLLPVSSIFCFAIQLPGMRVMGIHGLGGMSFPVMVGSCIVFFTLYSAIMLKEKMRGLDLCALLLCITGLVCLCAVV